MTDTELETTLARRLSDLASYAPGQPSVDPSDIPIVRDEERRTRLPKWAVAVGIAAAVGAVAFTATLVVGNEPGAGDRTGTGSQPPTAHRLTVEASNFHYQQPNYHVPAGITEITLVSHEGSHTLNFLEPELSYVALAVPDGRASARVDLIEGRTYTIFCSIPGHRASGMEATITVGPPKRQAK